jgi:hypothetical protein
MSLVDLSNQVAGEIYAIRHRQSRVGASNDSAPLRVHQTLIKLSNSIKTRNPNIEKHIETIVEQYTPNIQPFIELFLRSKYVLGRNDQATRDDPRFQKALQVVLRDLPQQPLCSDRNDIPNHR